MTKTVLSIGFLFPGGFAEYVPLSSKRSFLDADLVIFRPGLDSFYASGTYKGKPSLGDDASFRFQEAATHWRNQIQLAAQAGKTIIVFLPEYKEIWIDSGDRTYSGTGKNRQTTRIVNPSSNYAMLPPVSETIFASHGSSMKLTPAGGVLQSYWNEFGAESEYKVIFRGLKARPTIVTAVGENGLACNFTFPGALGRVVLLPPLRDYDHDPSDFDVYADDADLEWEKGEKKFGQRLLTALLALDGALKGGGKTEAPAWASSDDFLMASESRIQRKILNVEKRITAATLEKVRLSDELEKAGSLRALLFETGAVLERAIIEALGVLGFSAEGVKTGDSEFDAVFTSAEGRFLGEAEGKENKPINIDKLRQLEMNIQEDLARDEVTVAAHGVLFGNAYRLKPPSERPAQYFTEKCATAAARTGTSLVRTPDLFLVCRYIRETGDAAFAERCRRAILEQSGRIVAFPDVPNAAESSIDTVDFAEPPPN